MKASTNKASIGFLFPAAPRKQKRFCKRSATNSDCPAKSGIRSKPAKWRCRRRSARRCPTNLSRSTSRAAQPSNTCETKRVHGSPPQPPSRGNLRTTPAPARSAQDRHDGARRPGRVDAPLLSLERLQGARNQEPTQPDRARLVKGRTESHGSTEARGGAERNH